MGTDNGAAAKLARAEKDIEELFRRVNENSEKLAELPFIRKDVDEVKNSCVKIEAAVTNVSEANRLYVDRKLTEAREAETEQQKVSVARLSIWVGGIVALLCAIVAAIASLAGAGVL